MPTFEEEGATFQPENEGQPAQSDNRVLECTIDLMERSTTDGGSNGLCSDPRHFHSFRSVPFIVLPFHTCTACGGRLQSYVLGGSSSPSAAVNCIACGVYAHRRCAFSKDVEWHTKCPAANCTDDENDDKSSINEEVIDSGDTVEANAIRETSAQDSKNSEGATDTAEENIDSDHRWYDRESATKSIFRRPMKRTREVVGHKDFPVVRISASVDTILDDRRIIRNIQQTRANFPFLSSASLLSSYRNNCNLENTTSLAIEKCNTWNGTEQTSTLYSSGTKQDNMIEVEGTSQPRSKNECEDDCTNEKSGDDHDDTNANHTEDETAAPLYFATHGFQVVSTALQENIIASFSRFIPKEGFHEGCDTVELIDDGQKQETGIQYALSTVDSTLSKGEESQKSKNYDDGDDHSETHSEAHSLLENSEPQQNPLMDRKRLGLATVAGSIVGGVVGVGLAGPVGGVIGVKCGQTAGMLGLLLEGSVTASVLASGITAGMAAGQHIQDKHETRVLSLGEGTKKRALLMVRPTIQPPEPIWDEIYQEAKRSYSGGTTGIVNRLMPNESQAAKWERYEREVDIVETGEDELAIGDKILLLVSRILSNKDSLPGHVYRKLVEAFRRRSRENNLHDLFLSERDSQTNDATSFKSSSPVEIIEVQEVSEEERPPLTQRRRRDAHAVIKYVTTSLLLTRPGFGHSSSLTEKTATAVESLVFGEIYDLVMEEIELEYQNRDDVLLEKIADFERNQSQDEHDYAQDSSSSHFNYKTFVSDAAINSLHCLTQAHSAVDKLRYCVMFLEKLSEKFSSSPVGSAMGADSLLKMVCQHILLAKVIGINSQIAFLEEFARDEQLLRGREGYALVTLQASLHFLNSSTDFESDIFCQD